MKITEALALASLLTGAAACETAKNGYEVACGDHGTICIDAEDIETASCLTQTACWWHCAYETNASDCSDVAPYEFPQQDCTPSTDYLQEIQDDGILPETKYWHDYSAENYDVVVTYANGTTAYPGKIGPICIHEDEDPVSYLPEFIDSCNFWVQEVTEPYLDPPTVTGSCNTTVGPWPDDGTNGLNSYGPHIQLPNKCKKKVACYAESSLDLQCEQQGNCCQQLPGGVCDALANDEFTATPVATTQAVSGTLQVTLNGVTLTIPVTGRIGLANATSCSDPRGCPVYVETIDLSARQFRASTAWGFSTNVPVDRFDVALAQPALAFAPNASTIEIPSGALLFDLSWVLMSGATGAKKWRLTPSVSLSRSALRYGGQVTAPNRRGYDATLTLDVLP